MRIPPELEVFAGFITFLPPKCSNLANETRVDNGYLLFQLRSCSHKPLRPVALSGAESVGATRSMSAKSVV